MEISLAYNNQFLTGVHSNEKNHHTSSGTMHKDIDHTGLNAGFRYDGLHLPGDVVEPVVGGGGYVDALLQKSFIRAACFYNQFQIHRLSAFVNITIYNVLS